MQNFFTVYFAWLKDLIKRSIDIKYCILFQIAFLIIDIHEKIKLAHSETE